MLSLHEYKNLIIAKRESASGFSLIEMMIVIALVGTIVATVITSQSTQTRSFSTQQSVAKVQQDLRGSILMMQYDLMNSGRSGDLTDHGIEDIGYYNLLRNPEPAPGEIPANRPINFPVQQLFNAFPVLEFSAKRWDSDGDGVADQSMTIRYMVFDFNNDQRLDLGRQVAINGGVLGPPDLVAEGVIAVGYVFAYADLPYGEWNLARLPPLIPGTLGDTIWAVDTDGDGLLDFNVDTDRDGQITPADDISGDGIIGVGDGAQLTAKTNPRYIRAIKISVLLQSENPSEENRIDLNQYVVGNRVIPPDQQNRFNDRYIRRLKTITVTLRNFHRT